MKVTDDKRTPGQRFRDSCRAKGFVYVAIWVHADDADAVRTYARSKNGKRGSVRKVTERVPTVASGTR